MADSCLFELIRLRGLCIERDKREELRDKGNVLAKANN